MWFSGKSSFTNVFGDEQFSDNSIGTTGLLHDKEYYDNDGTYLGSADKNPFGGIDYYDSDGRHVGSSYNFFGDVDLFSDGSKCWSDVWGEKHYE